MATKHPQGAPRHLVTIVCGGRRRQEWLTMEQFNELWKYARALCLPNTMMHIKGWKVPACMGRDLPSGLAVTTK